MNKCLSLNSKQEVQDDHRQSSEETNENLGQGKTMEQASAKCGMDVKSARKYRDLDKLPSELREPSKIVLSGDSPRTFCQELQLSAP